MELEVGKVYTLYIKGKLYENVIVCNPNGVISTSKGLIKTDPDEISLVESDGVHKGQTIDIVKSGKGKSLRQLAEELQQEQPDLTRKEAIPQLVELGLTENSASAYYHRIWNQSKTD